ncbi:uncharacterized protein F4822DRAFT_99348 [Hypoxylon trugodes]|uniref:uncharacterized protein n=1 Tax=Hypoxylon trugodes TaxID=326681 RepID=UPI00219AF8F5|nr:uncharacterized protein F4822DRAFT_99348 [Hypoxylon trugodes]KAI1382862.1 hypothetical protein F4822DRAFT_99348 [Hypoxylon trugodes]
MTFPKLQYRLGRHFDFTSAAGEGIRRWVGEQSNWLTAAEKNIRQDLETSEKELWLIRDVLDELETTSEVGRSSYKSQGQMFLMRACQEYSASRCHMLEERLRHIHIWSCDEQMGRHVPDRAPDEWLTVDAGWRQWLSEQASLQTEGSNRSTIEHSRSGGLVRLWGPLFPILTTCGMSKF